MASKRTSKRRGKRFVPVSCPLEPWKKIYDANFCITQSDFSVRDGIAYYEKRPFLFDDFLSVRIPVSETHYMYEPRHTEQLQGDVSTLPAQHLIKMGHRDVFYASIPDAIHAGLEEAVSENQANRDFILAMQRHFFSDAPPTDNISDIKRRQLKKVFPGMIFHQACFVGMDVFYAEFSSGQFLYNGVPFLEHGEYYWNAIAVSESQMITLPVDPNREIANLLEIRDGDALFESLPDSLSFAIHEALEWNASEKAMLETIQQMALKRWPLG